MYENLEKNQCRLRKNQDWKGVKTEKKRQEEEMRCKK